MPKAMVRELVTQLDGRKRVPMAAPFAKDSRKRQEKYTKIWDKSTKASEP